jgi:hypothetical protein
MTADMYFRVFSVVFHRIIDVLNKLLHWTTSQRMLITKFVACWTMSTMRECPLSTLLTLSFVV